MSADACKAMVAQVVEKNVFGLHCKFLRTGKKGKLGNYIWTGDRGREKKEKKTTEKLHTKRQR